MQTENNVESLLNAANENESLLDSNSLESKLTFDENPGESLLDNPESSPLVADTDGTMIDFDGINEEQERENRFVFFMNPYNQAEILFQNYINSNPDMILSGKQKRNLKREFLKNAKKGKYKKLFMKQVDPQTDEKAFKKLNG